MARWGWILFYRSINFKARFYLHMNSGLKRKMVRRKCSTVDMSLKCLISPIEKVGETPILINQRGDSAIVNQYKIENVNIKYTGLRMQSHIKQGILAYLGTWAIVQGFILI